MDTYSGIRLVFSRLSYIAVAFWVVACVDPEDILLRGTVNIVVVDGTITNLAEEQIIRLNRSKSDPLTGRFGVTPITKATVEVVIDSSQRVSCHETIDGTYQLPSDFKGQIGHAYQLRFTLSDGTQYASNQQVIQPVPPIDKVTAQFNPKSLFPPITGFYTAGHDFFIDFNDPIQTRNYYRWDWKLWEKQEWCRTCYQGEYSVYTIIATLIQSSANNSYNYTSSNTTFLEDCYYELPPPYPSDRNPVPAYTYDYSCRTQCWEIIYSHDINVFDDEYTNGGLLTGRKVAQIPFYDHNPGLVEIRQSSMTADAYRYFKLFQQQTQNTGGLADTPPSALAGNVHNVANNREAVVGYFTASAVAPARYWLGRKDVTGISLGGSGPNGYPSLPGAEFFYSLNQREPHPELTFPNGSPQFPIIKSPPRPPTATCVSSDTRTPYKPEGWRD